MRGSDVSWKPSTVRLSSVTRSWSYGPRHTARRLDERSTSWKKEPFARAVAGCPCGGDEEAVPAAHGSYARSGRPRHNVLVTAFLGKEVRLYTFDLVFAPDRKGYWFRYTRHVAANPARTPRIGLAGSGGAYMLHDKRWIRPLLRLLSAYDCGRVSSMCLQII